MAALVDGQRYGLSSQGHNNENKTLIFVKLTDSALKAIDEYLSIRGNNGSQQPRIQFQGNQGSLTFPSSVAPGADHSFEFNFSPSSETEGLQGSFECVQKCGSRSLESLGPMLYKMHIAAKDDVYQTTRFRMAAAEEESKKNCTKVIKVSGPHVSRKVKVKKPAPMPVKPPPSPPAYSTMSSLAKPSPSLLPATSSATRTPVINGLANGALSNHHHHHINSSSGGGINNNSIGGSNSGAAGKGYYNNKSNPDIVRRNYRERIIHLLALRPYKKPELLARLMKDGIKEKDKKSLTGILSQVALLRENTYQLARHIWNEVQEDWPFYGEADKQLLKRRKPQNLTPPGDGEVSPPVSTVSSMSSNSSSSPPFARQQKRQLPPGAGIIPPPKRQRISHYTKQPEVVNGHGKEFAGQVTYKSEPYDFHAKSESMNGFGSNHFKSSDALSYNKSSSLDSRGLNGYHNNNHHNNHNNNNHHHSGSSNHPFVNGSHKAESGSGGAYLGKSDSTGFVPSSHGGYNGGGRESKSETTTPLMNGFVKSETSLTNGFVRESKSETPTTNGFVRESKSETTTTNGFVRESKSETPTTNGFVRESKSETLTTNGYARESKSENALSNGMNGYSTGGHQATTNGYNRSKYSTSSSALCNGSTGGSRHSTPSSSPESHDVIDSRGPGSQQSTGSSSPSSLLEFPAEHLKKYTAIASNEQRAQYKADFNSEYEVYRDLHAILERVSKRFVLLEQRLRNSEEGSDERKRIKDQVVREYKENKRNQDYQDARRKFNHLHQKLSHIKKLVLDYDNAQVCDS